LLECPVNASENYHIDQGDSDQEKHRDSGAEYPANILQKLEMLFRRGSSPVCNQRGNDDNCRMSESEVQTHRYWPLSVLHQLASNVIDRRNVVGIDRVPKTKCISKNRSTEKHRFIMKRDNRPNPSAKVYRHQKTVNAGNPVSEVA
jgi:hypothetical protein